MESPNNITCQNLPTLLSSFVDTFVDFSVSGGIFLPTGDNPLSSPPPLQTVFPSPSRLVAIGDLHGDLAKTKQALRIAGLIDSRDRWSGGSATVVQVGDVLDRGGDELKILYFLEKLRREASKAGGNLITMNGNHEIMNLDGDFRYVTKEGLDEFVDWVMWVRVGNFIKRLCFWDGVERPTLDDPLDGVSCDIRGANPENFSSIRARMAALRPNGPIARRFLSKNQTVVVVGDSVFGHGGLLPKHVLYGLEKINKEVSDWIHGVKDKVSRQLVRGRNSVVWLRKFSNEKENDCDCSMLEHVLETIPGVKRMIMGHTIQENGINGVCGNRAIRIDVGMSRGCSNGLPEMLEIFGDSELRVLTSNPLYDQNRHQASVDDVDGEGRVGDLWVSIPKQVEVNA